MENNRLDDSDLKKIIEAVIFYSKKPVSLRKLSANIPEAETDRIREILTSIGDECEENHGFKLAKIAGGYLFLTDETWAEWIKRFESQSSEVKLSNAALETLAIIAFKQPVTRAEVEAIRGVGCSQVINGLIEKKLVTIKGRSPELGAPLLYGITKEFLSFFGLDSVRDLPAPDELGAV